MTGRTGKAVLGAAVAMFFALPATANASIFCVDVAAIDCNPGVYMDEAGFLNALDDAETSPGPDEIRLGPETYDAPIPNGFPYSQSEDLAITGAGQGATVIKIDAPPSAPVNPTSYLGLDMLAGTNQISVTGLTVTLPTPADTGNNQTYKGINISGAGTVEDVSMSAPSGINIIGYGLQIASGLVRNFSTDFPRESPADLIGIQGSANDSDDLVVENSGIISDTPIFYSNPNPAAQLELRRSSLAPGGNGIGLAVAAATASIENTLINLDGQPASVGVEIGYINPGNHTSTAVLDGVTIAGTAFNNKGVRVVTDFDDGGASSNDVSTLTMRNSIIDPAIEDSITRLTDTGGTANVIAEYSNYDPADVFERNDRDLDMSGDGTGSITAGAGVTNVDPLFVGGGNFELQATSPLIDAGEPAAPAPGALDYEGDPRSVLGKPGCAARRDVGADEFVPASAPALLDCIAPDTSVTGRAKVKSKKKRARVSFTLTATEAGSTFECSLDGGPFAACSSPFTTRVKSGSHRLTVRAKDSSGNQDATPVSFAFRVVKKKPKKK